MECPRRAGRSSAVDSSTAAQVVSTRKSRTFVKFRMLRSMGQFWDAAALLIVVLVFLRLLELHFRLQNFMISRRIRKSCAFHLERRGGLAVKGNHLQSQIRRW